MNNLELPMYVYIVFGMLALQKIKHYPPGNHHANHFYKCPISRSQLPANHRY